MYVGLHFNQKLANLQKILHFANFAKAKNQEPNLLTITARYIKITLQFANRTVYNKQKTYYRNLINSCVALKSSGSQLRTVA